MNATNPDEKAFQFLSSQPFTAKSYNLTDSSVIADLKNLCSSCGQPFDLIVNSLNIPAMVKQGHTQSIHAPHAQANVISILENFIQKTFQHPILKLYREVDFRFVHKDGLLGIEVSGWNNAADIETRLFKFDPEAEALNIALTSKLYELTKHHSEGEEEAVTTGISFTQKDSGEFIPTSIEHSTEDYNEISSRWEKRTLSLETLSANDLQGNEIVKTAWLKYYTLFGERLLKLTEPFKLEFWFNTDEDSKKEDLDLNLSFDSSGKVRFIFEPTTGEMVVCHTKSQWPFHDWNGGVMKAI